MFTRSFNKWLNYLKVSLQLIRTDFVIFKQEAMLGELINTVCWVSTIILVTTYVFPMMGMPSTYGAFTAVACIATCSYFETFGTVSSFIADLDGNRTITFPLTLPIPSSLVFISSCIFYAIRVSILSIIIIPLAKLLLGQHMDLTHLSLLKSIVMFITVHIFSGFFGLFIASSTRNMTQIMNIWNRALFPMWFFGGAQFSWYTLHILSPKLSYIALCNPFLYGFEGLHNAFLGASDYLSFGVCAGVIWVMTVVFGCIAIKKLKKRLDFV